MPASVSPGCRLRTAEQIAQALELIERKGKPVAAVARLLGVHRETLYRKLAS
ncbi:helix-turn-helix domain-containing protein [Sinorhizobium meliloti]|uniref:helix-turn-helix domain-containing protein n=1 Tax=Rhizobium meliloti TaxID=382 RepID=UPI0003FDD992|nr:helix-turn-helix domain-containing protein [Sinorhizobium meliloti]